MGDFANFFKEARLNGYGTDGARVTKTNEGYTTEIHYTSEKYPEYEYIDIYSGAEMFFGREEIKKNGLPHFSMSYGGTEYKSFKENPEILECLKDALVEGALHPATLRGPKHYISGNWVYVVDDTEKAAPEGIWWVRCTEYIIPRSEFDFLINEYSLEPHEAARFLTARMNEFMFVEKYQVAFICSYQGGSILL